MHASAREAMLDGQFDDPDMLEHLSHCSACGAFLAALHVVDRLSPQVVETPPVPRDLTERVLSRVFQPDWSEVVHRPSRNFGTLLKKFRGAAGLTQEELAERSGLTVQAISLLERSARRRPRPSTVLFLASALGLSEADRLSLLRLAHDPPADSTPPITPDLV